MIFGILLLVILQVIILGILYRVEKVIYAAAKAVQEKDPQLLHDALLHYRKAYDAELKG